MNNLVKYALGALVIVCMVLGVWLHYRGVELDAQARTIATQAAQIEGFEKDKAAQDVADKQLQAEKDKIAKERDKVKKDLKDALKGNACTDAQLPDDAKRVLKELYGGKGA